MTSQLDKYAARHCAVLCLKAFYENADPLAEIIAKEPLFAKLNPSDQRFVKAMLLGTLRHHGQLSGLIETLFHHPLKRKMKDKIMPILLIGATQLIILNIPAHAVCNEMVGLTKALKLLGLAGLVNQIMRQLAQIAETLETEGMDSFDKDFPPLLNLSPLLIDKWKAAYGFKNVLAIAKKITYQPSFDISFKSKAAFENTIEDMQSIIEDKQLSITPLVEFEDCPSLRIENLGLMVENLSGFKEGAWWVQDFAASLPVHCLGDIKGKAVLDLCAAPGGKAMQAMAHGAQVTALDKSPKRVRRLKDNFKRIGFKADILTADLLMLNPKDINSFDFILLDAPCSASGTLRRHPEILLRLSDDAQHHEIIETHVNIQKAMLKKANLLLKPNGILVYAVCSLDPEEGEGIRDWIMLTSSLKLTPAQIDSTHFIKPLNELLDDNIDAKEKIENDLNQGFLRLLPSYNMDGFYIAKFVKNGDIQNPN